MICTNFPPPSYLILSDSVPPLLYYSHVPTGIIALLMGFFVFLKNKNLLSKILFSLSVVFSLWLFINLIVWTNVNSDLIMFVYPFFGILNALIFILCLYFLYVFINKEDISFKLKLFLGVILAVAIIFCNQNATGFDFVNCGADEAGGWYSIYFYYGLELFFAIWILVYGIYKYIKEKTDFRKQIFFLIIGLELFLFSFFFTGFLASYLVEKYSVNTNYSIEFYGLFGMTVFMGFLAYLIVRYKAFNIKLMATQALVAAIVILVGSEFFFVRTFVNQILTGITLALSMIGGWMLVRSVKLEVERKEQLQVMTDKLAVANDQLRKLDNAKSEFISIASHQLRTPLTAVKGYASLMLEGSYGQIPINQKDVLNKMYQANERLIDLVEDLLNLSRIESGRMEYKFEKVKMEEVLQEIYDTFIIKAKDRKLTLDLLLPSEPLPEVTTDRNKIREVISNFTDNAVKYTPEGGVKIEAYQDGKNVVVAVKDTGIGIPKDEMPYLFAKFSRGKDVNRLSAGGTGLGLHVGKRMMDDLHGHLWVESEGAGKGSTFFVEIPLEAMA